MTSVLVFGESGQIGKALRAAQPLNMRVQYKSKSEANFENLDSVLNCLQSEKPNIVINCVGYTAVDKAEDDKLKCYKINTEIPGYIAKWCRLNHSTLVHFSTDYVFDGKKTSPYLEEDEAHPLSVYGRSKRDSENLILSENPESYIIRTSWVYSEEGPNFVNTMLKLQDRTEIKVVNDQTGSPTYALDLAQAIWALISHKNFKSSYGIYHCSGAGQMTWYEFAKAIFEFKKGQSPQLVPISTSEYGAKAQRPLFSKLDTTKIESVFGVVLPQWQDSLKMCLEKKVKGESH
jgi:dTDP-4-dehydrorhamnose reductase